MPEIISTDISQIYKEMSNINQSELIMHHDSSLRLSEQEPSRVQLNAPKMALEHRYHEALREHPLPSFPKRKWERKNKSDGHCKVSDGQENEEIYVVYHRISLSDSQFFTDISRKAKLQGVVPWEQSSGNRKLPSKILQHSLS